MQVLTELGQQLGQIGRDDDLLGCRRDLEEGPIDIQKQCGRPVEIRWCHPALCANREVPYGATATRREYAALRSPRTVDRACAGR